MVSPVKVNNDGSELIVVQITEDDKVQFIKDLKDNLKAFELINVTESTLTFKCEGIDFSDSTRSDKYEIQTRSISFGSKVLIRNKYVVLNDCTQLLMNKVLIIQ